MLPGLTDAGRSPLTKLSSVWLSLSSKSYLSLQAKPVYDIPTGLVTTAEANVILYTANLTLKSVALSGAFVTAEKRRA